MESLNSRSFGEAVPSEDVLLGPFSSPGFHVSAANDDEVCFGL